MSRTIQEKLHRQHFAWLNDHTMWRSDIEAWRKELRAALDALDEARDMLRRSLDAMEDHAETVWVSEQRRHAHELALYQEAMAGERRKTDKQWAAVHHKEAALHERTAAAHERIKRYHHEVVAEVTRLLKQARQAI